MPKETKAVEFASFGGVDSRSNPLNMPQNRSLRMLNWTRSPDGHLELRWGYAAMTMTGVTIPAAIHSIIPYKLWNGSKFYIIGAGLRIYNYDASSGVVSAIGTIPSTIFIPWLLASSNRLASYNAADHVYLGNGVDQLWFDGTRPRRNGLRTLTAAEVLNISVTAGVREITSANAASVTLTPASGGSLPAAVNGGPLFYVAFFDTTTDELGPATISVGSGRVANALNDKITVAVLPDLSAVNTNWIKLIGRTGDGTIDAGFCSLGAQVTGGYATRTGTTASVLFVSHGLSTGDVILQSGFDNDDYNKIVTVTVTSVDTYTHKVAAATGADAPTTGGKFSKLVKVANAATTVDITDAGTDTAILINANRGIAASVVGGAQPGYKFYASIYKPNGGGHVGNRVAIGARLNLTDRANVKLAGLPDLSAEDTEYELLIGRTGDGAEVPYAVMDAAGNWISAINAATSLTITESSIDGASELPTRNGIIPAECDKFARVGDHIFAADSISATLRRSASEQDSQTGDFVGDPAQSWAPNDIMTFPTAEVIEAIAESDLECVCWTRNDCAIASDLAGVLAWRGPWDVGIAGRRAWCKYKGQLWWLSGEKQLCTFVEGQPTPVSDEYEATLLSKIPDANLSTVELVPVRDVAARKDEIRIEYTDANGASRTAIHDFTSRDARSPYGQGYESAFAGPLATPFTSVRAFDGTGKRIIVAGASTGRLYKLYTGSNDAGTEFTADAIALLNAGTERPSLPHLDWYGDSALQISVGQTLKTVPGSPDDFEMEVLTGAEVPDQPPGYENDSRYTVNLDAPEINHVYLRMQLTSHSADGSLALNDPPHMPLETYGRVWQLVPEIGPGRGH